MDKAAVLGAVTETVVARVAIGLVALHVADDNFLQPQPGTSASDHLVSGLVPIVVLALAGWAYPRFRAGARATIALLAGLFGIVTGIEAVYYTSEVGPWATTTRDCSRFRPAWC